MEKNAFLAAQFSKISSEMHGWVGDELKVVGSLVGDLIEKGGGEIMEMYRNIPEE